MEMITTSSISSMILQSLNPIARNHPQPYTLGYRIVSVTPNQFQHRFVALYSSDDDDEKNRNTNEHDKT
jgi:hypothetical protein